VPVTAIVFFAIVFIGMYLHQFYNVFGDFYLYSIFYYGSVAVATVLPVYLLYKLSNDDLVINFNEENRLQYALYLLAAVAMIFILFAVISGKFYYNPVYYAIYSVIIAVVAAVLAYYLMGKIPNVEPLPSYVTRKNHYLALCIGYICSIYTSLLGIIIGIYLYTRKDNEYSKIYGIFLIGFSILMWLISVYIGFLVSYI
jgi:hypothetical protein